MAALDAGWHRLALAREGDALTVEVDGKPAGACAVRLPAPARIGLRGSAADHVEVDDLDVESAAPPLRVREDFANHRRAGLLFLAALGLVAAVDAGAALGVRRARDRNVPLAPALGAVNLALAVCAGLALLADTVYFGRLHPKQVDFAGYENRIEYEGQIVPRLARAAPEPQVWEVPRKRMRRTPAGGGPGGTSRARRGTICPSYSIRFS